MNNGYSIRSIFPEETEQALDIIVTVTQQEIFKGIYTFEQVKQRGMLAGEFNDLLEISKTYFDNGGIFLVLLDNEKVVGTGAIKKLTDDICELKRMWFLREYRGKGLGSKMAFQLLEFARVQGYSKVRLDVYYPEIQTHAVALYNKLGFYEIEPYNTSPAKLFMEKTLSRHKVFR